MSRSSPAGCRPARGDWHESAGSSTARLIQRRAPWTRCMTFCGIPPTPTGWRLPPGCLPNRQGACFASSSPRDGLNRVSQAAQPRRAYDRGEMSLEDGVSELLAGPLNEFTNRRNSKSKELKAASQGELAAEVTTLKKPPVAVWAVNQLASSNKSVLERLRRAGEDVVQAQSGAVAGRKNAALELRSASDALQRELEVAVRAAGDVLRADENAADEATP